MNVAFTFIDATMPPCYHLLVRVKFIFTEVARLLDGLSAAPQPVPVPVTGDAPRRSRRRAR